MDVILTPHDVVRPDLVALTDSAQVRALLVELLSPSTGDSDPTTTRPSASGTSGWWIPSSTACRAIGPRRVAACSSLPARATDWPGLTLRLADLWR